MGFLLISNDLFIEDKMINVFKVAAAKFSTSTYLGKIRPKETAPQPFCHGGFGDIFSNETSSSFSFKPKIAGGVYLGIGSHQNFDHIVRTNPDRVILADVSEEVVDHLIGLRALLKVAHNPFEFLCVAGSIMTIEDARKVKITNDSELMQAINTHIFRTDQPLIGKLQGDRKIADVNLAYARFHLRDEEEFKTFEKMVEYQCDPENFDWLPSRLLLKHLFKQTFFNPYLGQKNEWQDYQNNWLRSLELYDLLRRLALADQIAILQGNIADSAVHETIRESLSEIEAETEEPQKITTAYFSNVEKYIIFTGQYREFVEGLRTLPWSDEPLALRSYSYVTDRKVNLYDNCMLDQKDPFFYQVSEGQSARFFDEDELPSNEEELIKSFLFTEAVKKLLQYGRSIEKVKLFVRENGSDFFEINSSGEAYLDIPALEMWYQITTGIAVQDTIQKVKIINPDNAFFEIKKIPTKN
jgi:hypothetical protein